MSIKKGLIINTSINLAGYFYLLLASFFSISILLHNLGRDLFGIYLLLGAVPSLASVFDFGLAPAIIRKLSIPDLSTKEKNEAWQTSFFIFMLQAIVLFIAVIAIFLIFPHNIAILNALPGSDYFSSIIIIALIIFVNQINSHLICLPQANQRFGIVNIKTFLVGTANTIFAAVASIYTHNLGDLFMIQLLFHVFTMLLLVLYSLQSFDFAVFLPHYHKKMGKELISFGLKNFVGTLASQVEAQFSKYALGAMVSAGAITAFSIPQSIVQKGAGVVSQVAQAIFPFSVSLLKKERIRKLRNTVLGVQLLTFLGGVLAVVLSYTIGQQFLMWWLKDVVVVSAAWPVLKIMSFYFLLTSLTPVPSVIMQGIDHPQIPSFFAVLTTVIEIILIIILIPQYQLMGVAYATLIASGITVPTFLITTWVYFSRKLHQIETE